MSIRIKSRPVEPHLSEAADRRLLQCRFDYHQRTWNFPALPPGRTGEASEPGPSRAATAMLAAIFAASAPAWSGGPRVEPAGRQRGFRHLTRRVLRKSRQAAKQDSAALTVLAANSPLALAGERVIR